MVFAPGPEIIPKYFPDLTTTQKDQFKLMGALYADWNQRINVISRKDMDRFYRNHVLHSLGIAKIQEFKPGDAVLDVGTGGGFPGIPLAILFPDVRFHLIDSIGKKIKIVEEIISALGLTNVSCEQIRAEDVGGKYDYIVSRAVTRLSKFIPWVQHKLAPKGQLLFLKGGDLEQEIQEAEYVVDVHQLAAFFEEEFFETKKVLLINRLID